MARRKKELCGLVEFKKEKMDEDEIKILNNFIYALVTEVLKK